MSTITIQPNDNGKIKNQGVASVETNNGTSTSLTVTNLSRVNQLIFTVSGASGDAILNNDSLENPNGRYIIPPNNPNYSYNVQGNMLGAIVTITNTTSPSTEATAFIQNDIIS